ncbi:putative Ig domain-containing protein [uncultured Psychromonas sp.]|uniref:putative Ig domain-containing protein n=1 Tax=uncultured Psychromonas sp. TaxID=173974 RepID=UPI00261780B9|nr:putative Ig domain-containing protein [uncultured Psychromonas sp.]
MINKKTCLAASIALALTACGGSGGSDSGSDSTITAIDGYLANAELWVDTNDNLTLDSGDTVLPEKSDEKGQFTLPADQQGHAVFIKAIAGETIDSVRGVVSTDFELSAPAGSTVANPMTNMVVQQLEADSTRTLTQADAEDAVIKLIQDSGLTASRELIFGDYLADTSDQQAQALNIIGEILVDNAGLSNAGLSIESQLQITSEVAIEVQKVVEVQGSLTNFYPTVTMNNGEVEVAVNSRPEVAGTIETQTLEYQDTLTEIDVTELFSDADQDSLTYQLVLKGSEQLNGLTIIPSTGIISGTPTVAGTFEYQAFAYDGKARSYPINFTVIVETENAAPTFNEEIATLLQTEVSTWVLTVGEAVDYELDISALFTDAESDVLTYTFNTNLSSGGNSGLSFSEQNGTLTFSGTPSNAKEAQTSTLFIYAEDSVNDKTEVSFTLPEITESTTPSQTLNTLEGNKWYFTEHGSFNDNPAQQVWCDTFEFTDGIIYRSVRTSANLTTCPNNASTEVGSYTIGDNLNILNASLSFTEGNETITENRTYTVQATDDNIENAILVLSKPTDSNEDGGLYTYFSTAAAAESRINIKSDDGAAIRDVEVYLPSEETLNWKKGLISVSLLENNNSQDSGIFDANITFNLGDEGVTCDQLQESFSDFTITSNDGTINSDFDCYEDSDEGSANIDLDIFEELTEDTVYSIIGYTNSGENEYIEKVKFNIEWTGTGNNE